MPVLLSFFRYPRPFRLEQYIVASSYFELYITRISCACETPRPPSVTAAPVCSSRACWTAQDKAQRQPQPHLSQLFCDTYIPCVITAALVLSHTGCREGWTWQQCSLPPTHDPALHAPLGPTTPVPAAAAPAAAPAQPQWFTGAAAHAATAAPGQPPQPLP